jgi:ATP-binding cassette subfamily B (MDR/TAP) protein 1
LSKAYKAGKKRAHIHGLGYGFSNLFVFSVMSLGFWYGGQLILSGENEPGDVIAVFFSILLGAMGVGNVVQTLPEISKARGAAVAVFEVIDKKPQIVSGAIEEMTQGRITVKDVKFSYPTRPEARILDGFSFSTEAGQHVALVGASGGGKSTVIQLLERFYDANEGSVMIDDVDTRQFDLTFLRSQIGLVSQEPTLFSGTIRENIMYGKPDATDEEIVQAAIQANAHNFISALPEEYETPVGEKGTQLSGGQKQRKYLRKQENSFGGEISLAVLVVNRIISSVKELLLITNYPTAGIAIARAVLKNPKILLLDEATSALDNESERLVQEALDKLMQGRTTLVIAHRLSTIQNADKICVVQHGRVVEEGRHEELIALNGVYRNLVEKHQKQDRSGGKKDKSRKEKSKKKRSEQIDC